MTVIGQCKCVLWNGYLSYMLDSKNTCPQYGRQLCYEEKLSMARGKPKKTEMTTEINSNLKYAI